MLRFLMFSVCLALAIPPGMFEPADDSTENIQQELLQTCSEDGATITESETEDPELFFRGLALFEHYAQFSARLGSTNGPIVIAAEVDPQGRRPPPENELSTIS